MEVTDRKHCQSYNLARLAPQCLHPLLASHVPVFRFQNVKTTCSLSQLQLVSAPVGDLRTNQTDRPRGGEWREEVHRSQDRVQRDAQIQPPKRRPGVVHFLGPGIPVAVQTCLDQRAAGDEKGLNQVGKVRTRGGVAKPFICIRVFVYDQSLLRS